MIQHLTHFTRVMHIECLHILRDMYILTHMYRQNPDRWEPGQKLAIHLQYTFSEPDGELISGGQLVDINISTTTTTTNNNNNNSDNNKSNHNNNNNKNKYYRVFPNQ
jgi:hypothetical protein